MANPTETGGADEQASGFEALDAKAEALEAAQAAREASEADTSPLSAVATSPQPAPAEGAPAPSASGAASLQGLFTGALRCGESAWRLQAQAIHNLSRARGPQDVLAVQMELSQDLLALYASETRSVVRSVSGLFHIGRASV